MNQVTWLFSRPQPRAIAAPVEPVAVDAPAFDGSADLRKFSQCDFDAVGNINQHNRARERVINQALATVAGLSHEMHRLFQPHLNKRAAIRLVQYVAHGEGARALNMLKANPVLLTLKVTASDPDDTATVKTFSGKILTGVTAFQAALCEKDRVLAEMMRDIYVAANPENGRAVLEAQFNEIFPRGFAAHVEAEKQAADTFEREVLQPLVNAITNATPAEIVSVWQRNPSALTRQVKAFQAAFEELVLNEKINNPEYLRKMFEQYNAQFDAWHPEGANTPLRSKLFRYRVIGWGMQFMSANDGQRLCTNAYNLGKMGCRTNKQCVNSYNYTSTTHRGFFYDDKQQRRGAWPEGIAPFMAFSDLSAQVDLALGSYLGIYHYNHATPPFFHPILGPEGRQKRGERIAKLLSIENTNLENLMQPAWYRRAISGCQVQ